MPDGLSLLGLRPGEAVRWKAPGRANWRLGKVTHRERDGSIGVTDSRGLARSVPVEQIEVTSPGRRGGRGWEPLVERAARTEQLRLL
jgi:hypothetical protein